VYTNLTRPTLPLYSKALFLRQVGIGSPSGQTGHLLLAFLLPAQETATLFRASEKQP
jgi:hypothetical protein